MPIQYLTSSVENHSDWGGTFTADSGSINYQRTNGHSHSGNNGDSGGGFDFTFKFDELNISVHFKAPGPGNPWVGTAKVVGAPTLDPGSKWTASQDNGK
jgi:hypothetical protein